MITSLDEYVFGNYFNWLTLPSTSANRLVVPTVKLSTVSSRAFVFTAPHIWIDYLLMLLLPIQY